LFSGVNPIVNIGILGSGSMGTTHARAYAALPGVRVAAVCSRSHEKAAVLANACRAAAYTDPYDVLDDPHIDAISNTLPTHLHENYTTAALQRGKHVLLEKPMALTLESCDRLMRVAAESDRILMIAQVLRFWPEYLAIAGLIHSRALGGPLAASAVRISSRPRWGDWFANPEWTGGAVLDLHIHDVDACNWLFGQPHSVFARGQRGPGGAWDQVFTLLDYGAVQANVEASIMLPDSHPFTFGLRVLCERGTVTFYPQLQASNRLLVYEAGKEPISLPFDPGNGYENQAAYFIECITGGKLPEKGTPEQGKLAVATCLAARQSLERNEIVSRI
jgi:UDP-N-acetylglucosamine 3-dehydrogenase